MFDIKFNQIIIEEFIHLNELINFILKINFVIKTTWYKIKESTATFWCCLTLYFQADMKLP